MKVRSFLSCVIMGLALGQISHAAERTFTLDLKGVEVKDHQEFDLKKLLSEQNPTLDLTSSHIISVDVAAIARTKDAMASLIIGGGKVASEVIPFAEKMDKTQSMQHVILMNTAQSAKDASWAVAIEGSVKVESVTINFAEQDQASYGIVPPPFPRPLPPRNPFPRRDREIVVRCESHDYRASSCYVGGNARYAYVRRQFSNASCYQGMDWWLDQRRNLIVVRNGCRADFGVVVGGFRR